MVPSKGLYERKLVPHQEEGEKDSELDSLTRGAQPGVAELGLEPRVFFCICKKNALCIMLDLIEGKCEL